LPIAPCFPATDAAPLEFAAVAVLDDHIFPSERVSELAEFKLREDDRTHQPVMGRVTAGFPGASWHIAGADPVAGTLQLFDT